MDFSQVSERVHLSIQGYLSYLSTQLPTLHSLDISFNLIESLRNLSTAKGLRELKAYNNRIKSTDHLRELKKRLVVVDGC